MSWLAGFDISVVWLFQASVATVFGVSWLVEFDSDIGCDKECDGDIPTAECKDVNRPAAESHCSFLNDVTGRFAVSTSSL